MDTTIISPLAALERLIDNGEDCWETIISIAQSAESDMTARRWLLGDVAGLVEKQYGKSRIDQFAKAANISVVSARQYRRVSAAFPNDTRDCFIGIGYTHYRTALKLGNDALSFLADASAESWTVEQAQIECKRRLGETVPPLKLLDIEASVIDTQFQCELTLWIASDIDFDLNTLRGKKVTVKLYEVTED